MDVRETQHAILTDRAGVIGSGGNSGFQAINLAVQFGATRLVLLGLDYSLARGVHWHGRHVGLNNPSASIVPLWRARLDAQAPRLAALGVQVVNASPESTLTAFEKVDLVEVLNKWACS